MKKITRQIAIAVISTTMATASFSVFAAEIVIDSGDSATIISSLPDSAAQEELVCSDTFNGRLGKCSGVARSILGFYRIQHIEEFEGTDFVTSFTATCDDGDIAVSAGYAHGLNPGLKVTGVGVTGNDPAGVFVQLDSPPAGQRISLYGMCADYFPLHES
jgi:hypothetical protein